MKTLVIIPSRLSATRLPGKPLLKINGISMISHVFKKAKEANSFLGKAKKFLKEEVFTTDPKTKITIPLPKFKGNTKGYGDFTFSDQYGNPQGAKTGKMIKANNGMMIQARGNKLARSKPTKLS